MPSVNAIQTNFTAGAISPRLFGRIDIAKYVNGAHTIDNFVVQRFGGLRKRGGLEYINEVSNSAKKHRLIPFIFSVTQSYILEFGDFTIRIYTNGGIVESGGSPVEVTSPYGEDDLAELQFAQSADVLYIAHPDYAPRQFERTSATTFTISKVDFVDGPFLEVNETSTTLTPASTGHSVPQMSNNTTPSAYVASTSNSSSEAYKMFNRSLQETVSIEIVQYGWLKIDLGSGNEKTVDAYFMRASAERGGDAPREWSVQGSQDDSTWVTLDYHQAETQFISGQTQFYEFQNKVAYRYYRLYYAGGSSEGADTSTRLAEWGLNQAASEQTAFNLTASAVTGINDGDGFQSTDVGRHIRLLGSDGWWRWAKIDSYTSTTVVKIVLYGPPLPDTQPIVNWRMGAWSDETGWPGSVSFYEGRLCWARTATEPETVWMSKVDDFVDHGVSDPGQDDDAITVEIRSQSLNEVKWIAESTDMFVGTSAAIRTIGPNTSTGVFSPTNIRQQRQSTFGAGAVMPIQVGNIGIYADYYKTALRELGYSFELNGYISQDISLLAEHLYAAGVKEMAYAQNPEAVIWSVMDDGTLIGMTYERDQEVVACHQHSVGGSDVVVESVASIPGTSGSDEIWFIVSRTVNSATVRYVERLSAGLSDTGDLDNATFLDSYLTYSGTSTTTITGLDHLENESVYVWSDAGKQGPYTVTSGAITVGSAVTVACVGLAYTSTYESLSPEAAARGGTAQTRLGNTSEVFLRLNRSMNGTFGPSDGTQETIEYGDSIDADGSYGDSTTIYTGDVRVPIDMKWERNKRLKMVHSDPTPFHCLGFIYEMRVSG